VAVSWGDGPWVADTSAWARASSPPVAPRWRAAAEAGDLLGCPVVTLELLYDAPNRDRVEAVAAALAGLRQAPIARSVTDAAITAVRELAARGSAGAHRVRVPDALVAAAAAERGFAVLHYDQHFDQLASVLAFRSQWVAEPGSIP
jgi:predicted nucleic acid-binding protein